MLFAINVLADDNKWQDAARISGYLQRNSVQSVDSRLCFEISQHSCLLAHWQLSERFEKFRSSNLDG